MIFIELNFQMQQAHSFFHCNCIEFISVFTSELSTSVEKEIFKNFWPGQHNRVGLYNMDGNVISLYIVSIVVSDFKA